MAYFFHFILIDARTLRSFGLHCHILFRFRLGQNKSIMTYILSSFSILMPLSRSTNKADSYSSSSSPSSETLEFRPQTVNIKITEATDSNDNDNRPSFDQYSREPTIKTVHLQESSLNRSKHGMALIVRNRGSYNITQPS